MDLSAPLSDVAAGVRGRLLQHLARLEQPISRRKLASIAEVAPSNATEVLGELIVAGIVSESRAGRASLVELNPQHLAVPHVLALAGLRGELIRRLRDRMLTWENLRGAWLFGSVARGDAHAGSDIDVLIVVDDERAAGLHDQLAQLHADVLGWTGNELQVVEHSEESWAELVTARNPLVAEIRDDGVVLVSRTPIGMERAS